MTTEGGGLSEGYFRGGNLLVASRGGHFGVVFKQRGIWRVILNRGSMTQEDVISDDVSSGGYFTDDDIFEGGGCN